MAINVTSTVVPIITSDYVSSFGWIDYCLFSLMLGVSLLIGIYFGFFSKQDNTTEYLLGGKRMSYFPIAMSLIASHVSGITLLGIPSEVYLFGSQYAVCIFTSFFTYLMTSYIFIPVFYKLQLTSTFEYLELRFARPVRIFCSVLYAIMLLFYIPIVVYVPALAFSQVTGFNVHAITAIICTICIAYTSIGGLKAVVWTDTIQFIVTVGSLFAVLFLGIYSIGGVSEIWRISKKGDRLVFFDMSPSLFVRNSFFGMSLGMTMTWVSHLGVNQGCVQKFLSIPTMHDAQIAMVITCVGMVIVKLVSVFTGLIIFAKYHACDPLLTGTVQRSDQVLPYYVLDVAGDIPGLPGLFLAGLVSSALSTMSASLNTVSGTIYEDFIEPWVPESSTKEAKAATIMKVTVVIVGAISVGMVLIIEHLGTIFQMSLSMGGISGGSLLGLFILGMMVPWSNSRGAMLGGCSALTILTIIVFGNQWYISQKRIRYTPLPTSTDMCPYPLNETIQLPPTLPPITEEDEPPLIFKLSFMYYTMLGTLIVVIVGVIGSYIFGEVNLKEVNPDHITPIMQRFLPCDKYREVPLKEIFQQPKVTEKEKESNKDQIQGDRIITTD